MTDHDHAGPLDAAAADNKRYRSARDPHDTVGSTRRACVLGAVLLGGMSQAEAEREFGKALQTGTLEEVPND